MKGALPHQYWPGRSSTMKMKIFPFFLGNISREDTPSLEVLGPRGGLFHLEKASLCSRNRNNCSEVRKSQHLMLGSPWGLLLHTPFVLAESFHCLCKIRFLLFFWVLWTYWHLDLYFYSKEIACGVKLGFKFSALYEAIEFFVQPNI